MQAKTKRSAWALGAGILTAIVLTTAVDVALHAVNFYPAWDQPLNDAQCIVATSYRVVIGALAAWLSARLAPIQPMRHALSLGVLGAVVGALGAVVTWDKAMGPHWYGIAVAALAIPQSWVGARIHLASTRSS